MTGAAHLVLAALLASVPLHAGSLYEEGMAARRRGDHPGAKALFLKMLEQDPQDKGALEGLSLECISLRQYDEAAAYLERWDALSPRSPYVLGLLARAQRGRRDSAGAAAAAARLAEAAPCDPAAWRGLDEARRPWSSGLLPSGRIAKTLSQEELDTPAPQRIIYESRSGGMRGRYRASPRLAYIAGAEFSQEAQRNDTGGFTYYNILDQLYSLGLEADPRKDLRLEAEYGQSLLHDIHGAGVGRSKFSRARLHGEWRTRAGDARLTLTRSPKYLRGAGGDRFFALLRRDSLQAEFETYALGLGLLARAGLSDHSERTTYKTASLEAAQELGPYFFQARYGHGQQEFFGATATGRLGYVNTDRLGLMARRRQEEKYLLSGSYGRTFFNDGNRTDELGAEATGWLPWCRELSGSYRLSAIQYRRSENQYLSISEQAHWLGGYWRRGWNRGCPACCTSGPARPPRFGGFWTMVGYEHGFLWDMIRSRYEGNAYVGELEWYQKEDLALKAQGRVSTTTVRDQSYSLGLQARYSF